MKMFNFTGWKDIFYFTFMQTIKNNSYKVTFIILCIIAAAAMPVAAVINDFTKEDSNGIVAESVSDNDSKKTQADNEADDIVTIEEVDTIYVCYDENDLKLSDFVNEWQNSYKCEFVKVDSNLIEEKKKDINTENTYALLTINSENGLYFTDIIVGWETMDHTATIDDALNDLTAGLEKLQVENIIPGINMPDEEETFPEVNGFVGDDIKQYSDDLNIFNYMIQLGYVVILIFIITFSGESIASSVVSEKAGKMVEFLMITVKPMAILLGKVLAILLTVLIQVFSMIFCGIVSAVICNVVNGNFVSEYLQTTIESLNNSQNTFAFNPATIIISVLFVLGGLLFYVLIASLCGAAVSKIEELSEGIVMFSFILIIGGYMSIGIAMKIFTGGYTGEPGIYELITYILPISSAFSVPQNLVTGYVGYDVAIISLIVLYGAVFLMAVLASKVYEYMLFYNGATLKLKDIIHIAIHGKVKEAK